MSCTPFLGSESLAPKSRKCFYTGLEVTVFTSASIFKFDVGRLTLKRQGNHILGIQQDTLGSLSCVAGICHGGPTAPVPEHAFNGLKPDAKSLDMIKQSPKAPKIQSFSGSKSSLRNSSRPKPSNRNFEEQLAVLERIHRQSQVPRNDIDLSQEAQVTHKFDISSGQQKENLHSTVRSESGNQALDSPHTSFQQSLEKQFSDYNSSSPCLDHSRAGLERSEPTVESSFTDWEPVISEPLLVAHTALSNNKLAFGHLSDGNEHMSHPRTNSGFNGANHLNRIIKGFERRKEKDNAQINTQKTNTCHTGRQVHRSIQHLDKEDICTRDYTLSHASQAAYTYQRSGSVNGMKVNGFHLKKHGPGCEFSNGDEQLAKTIVQAKESADVSSSSCKVASVRMPAYRMGMLLQRSLSDSIFYLESLGVDCSRLFRDDPTAMKCTVKQLRALVCALERHGLKSNDFGRIFNLCPKAIHLNPDGDLKSVTTFLFDEVGLSRKDFGKVIRRCPRLLVADVREQLRPTLSFLRNLGYLKIGQVVSNNPTLISFSVERKLIPKLRFLESLGLTYREAASMVVRFPAIFNYSVSDNLQLKYDYLVHEMGGTNKDLLAFPQYFGYSLETRILPRHKCIAKLGLSLSIQAILKLSDSEFNARFQSVGGHEHLSASPEMSNAAVQDCSAVNAVQFKSVERPEVRVLVSV